VELSGRDKQLLRYVVLPFVGCVAALALGALTGCGSTTSSSGGPSPQANIAVDRTGSWCEATGVYDFYTGNGRVTFFITLRNHGDESGTLDLIPVRHYDDGSTNDSPVDEVTSGTVEPGDVWRGHTDPFTYKAHEHEIVSCGLEVDGNEVPIRVVHD
jgi:hypothetical protein